MKDWERPPVVQVQHLQIEGFEPAWPLMAHGLFQNNKLLQDNSPDEFCQGLLLEEFCKSLVCHSFF